MSRFKQEYQNLFLAINASKQRINDYSGKFQALKESLIVDSYGVETALKQSENDEQLKKKLIEQIESVKKLVSQLKERDLKNQERIQILKQNIDQINETIKNWQSLNNGNDEFNERMAEIDSLKLDRELLDQKQGDLLRSISSIKSKIQEKNETIDSSQLKNRELVSHGEKLDSELKTQEQKRASNINTIEQLKRDKQSIGAEQDEFERKTAKFREDIHALKLQKIELSKQCL